MTAVNCNGKVAQIVGTAGADLLIGNTGPNVMHGLGGNDELRAGGGNDDACGGNGDDYIYGGPGNDWLDGNAGHDEILGANDNDTIYGGSSGNDILRGGPGADDLHGYIGKDQLFGDGGDDVLYGQGDNDVLNGGDGEDHVWGGDGDDEVFGGTGKDYIYGEAGTDGLRAEPWPGSSTIDYSRGGANADCIDLFGWNNAAWGEGGDDKFFAYFQPWVDCGSGTDVVNYADPPDGLFGCEFVLPLQPAPAPITCFGVENLVDESETLTISGQDDAATFEVDRVRCGLKNVIGAKERIASNGQYCFVSFNATNNSDIGLQLATQCQILVDEAGMEYLPDEVASRIVMEERSLDDAILPGETMEETGLVYDIPMEAVAAGVRLHGSCESSGFAVDLQPIDDASSRAGFAMTASIDR